MSILIPATTGIFFYKRLPDYAKVFTWILITGTVTEVVAYGVAVYLQENRPVYSIYLMSLSVLYAVYFTKSGVTAYLTKLFYGTFGFTVLVFILEPMTFPSLPYMALACLVIINCLWLLRQVALVKRDRRELLLNALIFFYFLASFVYLVSHRFVLSMNILSTLNQVWQFQNLVCNLAFTFALWKLR
jgi:hypothetical protein